MLKINSLNSFKSFNIFMMGFCIFTFCMNYTGVNIINCDKAVSKVNDDVFEYSSTKDSFTLIKNNKIIGIIPTNGKFEFKKQCIPSFCCNVATGGLFGVFMAGVAAVGGAEVLGFGKVAHDARKENDADKAVAGTALAAIAAAGTLSAIAT